MEGSSLTRMSEQSPDESVIKAYLTGTLSKEDTERLDELSVTDDLFADLLTMVENDLVDAYVRGELTESSAERLKSEYLTTRSGRQKLGFAQALAGFSEKHTSEQSAKSKQPFPVLPAKQRDWAWFSESSKFIFGTWSRWAAASAAVILLVLGVWLTYDVIRLRWQISRNTPANGVQRQNPQNAQKALPGESNTNGAERQEPNSANPQNDRVEKQKTEEQQRTTQKITPSKPRGLGAGQASVASFILTPQMRSVQQTQTVTVPAKTSVVELHLQLEPEQFSRYRVVLVDKSNQTLLRTGAIKANGSGDNKTLNIRVPAALLKPQSYALQVYGLSAGKSETLNAYLFRVAR